MRVRRLKYYKDETFLTLYAAAGLDFFGASTQNERADNWRRFLWAAFPERAEGELPAGAPRPYVEFRLAPSPSYLAWLGKEVLRHPVAYVAASGVGKKVLEGATHADAALWYGSEDAVRPDALVESRPRLKEFWKERGVG